MPQLTSGLLLSLAMSLMLSFGWVALASTSIDTSGFSSSSSTGSCSPMRVHRRIGCANRTACRSRGRCRRRRQAVLSCRQETTRTRTRCRCSAEQRRRRCRVLLHRAIKMPVSDNRRHSHNRTEGRDDGNMRRIIRGTGRAAGSRVPDCRHRCRGLQDRPAAHRRETGAQHKHCNEECHIRAR